MIEADLEAEKIMRAEVVAEENRIQQEIRAKEVELRRQQEQLRAAELNRVRGTGELQWPAPGNSSITSPYGVRRHPVFKDMRRHNGIDIGGKHGDNVIAADTGTVITATYNSTYGNYIVISHGNGMTTLYAHLSSRKVTEGDVVTKGQLIGLIGSTGISTGPHLHFEVSVNGTRINPVTKL